jgi:hypothetical protein
MSGERMRSIRSALGSARLIIGVWLLCVGAHAAYSVTSILARADEVPDPYARSRLFQLLAFAFVRLPIWLRVLFALLLLRAPPQENA